MRVLLEAEIVPAYSQVAAFDVDDNQSYPEWEQGRTDFAQGPAGIAVATQDDLDGRVKVVVTDGRPPDATLQQTDMEQICSVPIRVSQGHLGIGSIVADDVHVVEVARGTHTVTVFGNVGRERRANSILIALEPAVTSLSPEA